MLKMSCALKKSKFRVNFIHLKFLRAFYLQINVSRINITSPITIIYAYDGK